MNKQNTLPEWLNYLENLHFKLIDMSLVRVSLVADKLSLQPEFPLIIVAGTNGKGSVCAMLSTILLQAGYKVGTYTSPHILQYNERIAVNLQPASDAEIIDGFCSIEQAREETSLTYFEFGTLAAIQHFIQQKVDVAVLEVGLGGRLDAVNIFDADVALVTNIDIDHCEYLGNTREAIAYEKSGIFRSGKIAFCADRQPPQTLIDHANLIGAKLRLIDKDFSAKRYLQQWVFSFDNEKIENLPLPALFGDYQLDNAALVLAAISSLQDRLPVDVCAIKAGLSNVFWPARFQILSENPQVIFDVAHNPHAMNGLLDNLTRLGQVRRQIAVFSMLSDKDISRVLQLAKSTFDDWYIAGLKLPRGMSSDDLANKMFAAGVRNIHKFDSLQQAWDAAICSSEPNDRVVVFGSFHTVAEVDKARKSATTEGNVS